MTFETFFEAALKTIDKFSDENLQMVKQIQGIEEQVQKLLVTKRVSQNDELRTKLKSVWMTLLDIEKECSPYL